MKFGNYHIVYLLGIGGIGMSALARLFRHMGCRIIGYDKTESSLTAALTAEGMEIHYDDDPSLIPADVLVEREKVLVIYTPALPADHSELNFFRDQGFEVFKRSEVLGIITRSYRTVAVAGSHGKTTTSSMIAHILKYSGIPSLSIVGGIVRGYDSNLIMEGEPEAAGIAIVEADEYDRSFLQLYPEIAVITSADADHLDVYGDHAGMLDSFAGFACNVAGGGAIFLREGLQDLIPSPSAVEVFTYGLSLGRYRAARIYTVEDNMFFDFAGPDFQLEGLKMPVPGAHNVENAIAAISVALYLGVDPRQVSEAIGSYPGVKRRFEYIIRRSDLVFIDDYAHHPREIEALLESVRNLYPGRKITAIFQPHLFSRTRDFAPDFGCSLSIADEVVLLDIYPAREQPLPGVDSGLILDFMRNTPAMRCTEAELPQHLLANRPEVLLTIGAGDIDRLVLPLRNILLKRYPHD